MNDLDMLKDLPDASVGPDEAAKVRMRAAMQARTKSDSRHGQQRKRVVMVLGVTALLSATAVAAAAAVHPWTADEPIAIPISSSGSGEDQLNFGITDPSGQVDSESEWEATVAEFAPAIRLPDGMSFSSLPKYPQYSNWTSDDSESRSVVVQGMVGTSSCLWASHWLDASRVGDQAATAQASRVLGDEYEWAQAAGLHPEGSAMPEVIQNGDTSAVQHFVDGCAFTGAWGSTSAEQDAKAASFLPPAIQTVQDYLAGGGDPQSFDVFKAIALDKTVRWHSAEVQPGPWPGDVFIARSAEPGVTLATISETGTQFCAVVTADDVVRGTTTHDLSVTENSDGVQAVDPSPVSCSPNGP
jgi:hypothetical protein